MADLVLALLGPFHAMLGDEPVPGLQSPRLQALLAYLAVETNRRHARRALGEMIWPNRPEGEALEALRYALSNLRTAIGDREADPPFLHITRSTVLAENSIRPAGRLSRARERVSQVVSGAEISS